MLTPYFLLTSVNTLPKDTPKVLIAKLGFSFKTVLMINTSFQIVLAM